MKKLLLLSIALLLAACAPSREHPSVTTNSVSALGGLYTKILSTKLNVPAPKPFTFKFDGEWEMRTDMFSLEKNLAFFTCSKEHETIQLRAMMKTDLYRDSSFTVEKDASEEAFINYYLKWDHDYWTLKQQSLQQGSVTGPVFNKEKKYGTIKTVMGKYQRCVFAALVDDAIYMMTGEAMESEKDICQTEAEVWESREAF